MIFRGISEEAVELSDLHCCIPMSGMVDSFNVSVAAGLLMHQATRDRTLRMVIPRFGYTHSLYDPRRLNFFLHLL